MISCPVRIRSYGVVDFVTEPVEVSSDGRAVPEAAALERDWFHAETRSNGLVKTLHLVVLRGRREITEHAIGWRIFLVQRGRIPRMTLCPDLASLRVQYRFQGGGGLVVGRDWIRNEIRRGDVEMVEQPLNGRNPANVLTGVMGQSEASPVVFFGIYGDGQLHAFPANPWGTHRFERTDAVGAASRGRWL